MAKLEPLGSALEPCDPSARPFATPRLWLRNAQRASDINAQRENSDYLPGYKLDDRLTATDALHETLEGIVVLFVAVPSQSFRSVVNEASKFLDSQCLVVSLTKGIEAGGFKLMSEIVREELPHNPRAPTLSP